MRQYAGNWAVGAWVMKPGVEERLNELPAGDENQIDQLQRMEPTPYEKDDAEMTLQKVVLVADDAQPGPRPVLRCSTLHLDDIESRTIREGEFVCNTMLGWNFGDGHLHDERLVAAVQQRLQPRARRPRGRLLRVAGHAVDHDRPQDYRVIDAALGVVERGTWSVRDCVAEQPWLPNGPVPLTATWTAPGYVRPGAEQPA